jgi:hypothetical protein
MMLTPGFTMYSTAGENLKRSHCKFCGRELNPHQAVSSGICGAPECHTKKIVQVGTELAKRRRREHEEYIVGILEQAAPEIGLGLAELDAPREQVSVVVIPAQSGMVEPLPAARRDAFRSHLEDISGMAFDDDPKAEADSKAAEMMHPLMQSGAEQRREEDEPSVVAGACATCWGQCCNRGADTALLLPSDIERYRAQHPEAVVEEVVELYLSHLPETSTRNSCVYHAATGCSLPRELRQNICNTYYCNNLRWLNKSYVAQGTGKVVYVAASADAPHRVGAFDLKDGYRPVAAVPPRPDADADADDPAGSEAAGPEA